MGLLFHAVEGERMVYWYLWGHVSAEDVGQELLRAGQSGDLSGYQGEIIYCHPDADFDRDIYHRIGELKQILIDVSPRMPPTSAFVCTLEQQSSAPQMWALVASQSKDIQRYYHFFGSLDDASLFLGRDPSRDWGVICSLQDRIATRYRSVTPVHLEACG